MTTSKREQAARWLSGSGIEIGALTAPLVVPAGVTVQYVDRLPTSDLGAQYKELADADLVPVSIVGDAQDLSVLADSSVDFVIANHLLEHLEDPIRGLREMLRVVRPGGVLYLALPDPRFTFDVDRDLTTVAHVIDEYRNGTRHTRKAHFIEWVDKAERHVEWMRDAAVGTGDERVRELMETDYSIHFHVWRPDTFLEFLVAARREADLEMELLEFLPRQQGDVEYIFIFLKGPVPLDMTIPPPPQQRVAEALQQEVAALRADAECLQQSAQRLGGELAAVVGSRSWRVTAPLRRVVATVSGLRLRRAPRWFRA